MSARILIFRTRAQYQRETAAWREYQRRVIAFHDRLMAEIGRAPRYVGPLPPRAS